MNRRITITASVSLAVGLGAGAAGTYWWLHGSDDTEGEVSLVHRDDHDDARDGHEGHDEQEEVHGEDVIQLTPAVQRENGIEIRQAVDGPIEITLTVPGEIVLNADRVAHIVPRVAGIVKHVNKRLGDEVKLGEVMAVLESRELAEAKASYLAAEKRLSLAEARLSSSESLRADGILPELEYLAIRKERDEAEIETRTAEHKLHARGLTGEEILGIAREEDAVFSVYELRAPFSGTVIEKHITLGEVVTSESDVFALADLDTVWANLTVYQKDLSSVRVGQSVTISAGHDNPKVLGTIEYVSPVVEEDTRTAIARAVLPNRERHWRPGVFVSGRINVDRVNVGTRLPATALQTVEGRQVVFVATPDGFEVRTVTVGLSDEANIEITSGLLSGERYVASGAFSLKAEIEKAA
ncbi:MAG: efflux RND transporter periplasmic adaptor subunit, partial [Phycisphaerae bacterium]